MKKILFPNPSAVGMMILIAGLTGCGAYRLGTTLPANMKTVYVPTFENTTNETGIEMEVTDAVITRFRQDGNLKPVSREEADTLVRGKIVGWDRSVLDYTGEDDDEVDEYRLYVTAEITFEDLRTGENILAGERIRGHIDFFIETNLPADEEDARPDAFKDLARRIVDAVVSIW